MFTSSSPTSTKNPTDLLSLERDHLTVSFGGYESVPYGKDRVDDGYWHHVVVVWESGSGRLSLYIDAKLVGSLSGYGLGRRLPS